MARPPALAARKARGDWPTPPALVDHVLDVVLEPVLAGRTAWRGLRVLDPACGDGRFLAAAGARLQRRFAVTADEAASCLVGVELDPATAAAARDRLGPAADVRVADALAATWEGPPADVVVGNPPYLSQLARTTSRGGRSRWGGGPYADEAVAFLALAVDRARPDGGTVGLVLPQSLLASRDAGPVRRAVLDQAALTSLWWSATTVFDADVLTVVATFERGAAQGAVRRWWRPSFDPLPDADGDGLAGRPTWSHLVADAAGVPLVSPVGAGTVGDVATATAGFRDQFYGLAPFVREGETEAPLVTSGLLEPGRCAWGERPARFAGRTFHRPGVDLAALEAEPRLARWVAARRVPKVLVATQTAVLEAAADPDGCWVPSVPVVSVEPVGGADVWEIAAVVGSPVASAWAAATYLGAGLGPTAIKLSARQVLGVPWPVGPLDAAADHLRRGDVAAAAAASTAAYGLAPADARDVLAWWEARLRPSRRRPRPARASGC